MICPVCGKDLEVVGEFAVCPAHGALPVNVCRPADARVEADLVAATYLYRNGVRHLLEMGRRADALALLTDFGYLMDRMRHLDDPQAAESVLADWRAVASGVLAEDERWWAVFFQERAHLLRRGSSPWPAYKILLQLAIEHADDAPVTRAAERWLAAGHCNWVWLRNRQRPHRVARSPCRALDTNVSKTAQESDYPFELIGTEVAEYGIETTA